MMFQKEKFLSRFKLFCRESNPYKSTYHYYPTPRKFFRPALARVGSLESKWQHVFSGIQDSS